jgi:acetyltransferase-like isoleucine patch superfamily enzyme
MSNLVARFLGRLRRILAGYSGRVHIGTGSVVRRRRLHAYPNGEIHIGACSMVLCRVDFDSLGGLVRIGDRCYLGASHLVCHTSITIGDDVIMSWGVTVVDHDSHSPNWDERAQDVNEWMNGRKNWDHVKVAPVVIGDKAWIGFGASILKGVVIGEAAVVGACSVVTRDVPAYCVVAGNPARVVRRLDPAARV